ncbi:DUF3592 domain-containing protein [Streptomyces boncukensis]|nr:DUF3592 domain-containing protein [Streptomyces boncukensis]
MPWEAVLVTAVAGAAVTGGAGYRLLRERALRRGGIRTHALVVGQDERIGEGGGGAGLVQAPVVEFTTADGRVVRTRSQVGSSVSSVVPGRAVTVFYNPADPRDVAIVGFGRAVPRLFCALGILGMVVAALFAALDEETPAAVVGAGVPVVLGSVLLGVGGSGIGQVRALRRRGGTADGVVVGESTSSTREGLTLHHPVVRFALPTGHMVETASGRGTLRRRTVPGQSVSVLYHPDDPYRMLLADDRVRPLFWLFAVVGLVVLGGTLAIVVLLTTR